MKLHPNATQHYQTITAYDEHAVEINAVRFTHSLIVLPELAPLPWQVTHFNQLLDVNFQQIAALNPDVVILGTGKRQHFIHPRLITSLTSRQIGVECMDSQAACRTYNILMSEGRRVALAMILESSPT